MKTIKRVSFLLVCMVMFMSLTTPTMVQARQPGLEPSDALPWRGQVNTSAGLIVRTHASPNAARVPSGAVLPNFRAVHITLRTNGWYFVYYNGLAPNRGWVYSGLVIRPAVNTMWVFELTHANVNYREGPGTNTPVITSAIPQNRIMPRGGNPLTNGFQNVIYCGLGAGWMSNNFLVSAPAP